MKNIIFKICLSFSLFLIYNCKAQTANDYINFYNGIVPKLNTIAANKTQYYDQNFSNFYNELLSKNINVVKLGYGYKEEPASKYYVLKLFFEDNDMWSIATDHTYQYPYISIVLENEIPSQIQDMVKQNFGVWNNDFVTYFSDMKIEKIVFVGINGYNNIDRSLK